MNKAPAYQMYASDWLKSRNVRFFTDYQRGWYIQLLNEAWAGEPQCMLPNNEKRLQLLAGVSNEARNLPDFNDRWADVQRMFIESGNYVYNERQMDELSKQILKRQIATKAGNKSALIRDKKRKALKRIKQQQLTEGNGRSTDVNTNGNGKATLHTSTSTSTSTSDFITNTPCSEPSKTTPNDIKLEDIFCKIPLIKKDGEFIVTKQIIAEYKETFPAVNVEQAMRECRQWSVDKPSRRKTKGGIRKHITGWMSKRQNGYHGSSLQINTGAENEPRRSLLA